MKTLHTPSEILEKAKTISVEDIFTVKSRDKNHQNKLNYLRAAFNMLQLEISVGSVSHENIQDRHWEILNYGFAMSNHPIYAASCDAMIN